LAKYRKSKTMSHLNVIAILEPVSGKSDRVVEIVQEIASFVKANDLTTLRYEITRHFNEETKTEEIILIESYVLPPYLYYLRRALSATQRDNLMNLLRDRYKDKAALDLHMKSEAFLNGAGKLQGEGLMAKPLVLKVTTPAGGFGSRL
jgi:quinol monooxygenase YgiN